MFTECMTNTSTRQSVEMPSEADIRKALVVLDQVICAVQDDPVFASVTSDEMEDAYDVFARFMEHPDDREPRRCGYRYWGDSGHRNETCHAIATRQFIVERGDPYDRCDEHPVRGAIKVSEIT